MRHSRLFLVCLGAAFVGEFAGCNSVTQGQSGAGDGDGDLGGEGPGDGDGDGPGDGDGDGDGDLGGESPGDGDGDGTGGTDTSGSGGMDATGGMGGDRGTGGADGTGGAVSCGPDEFTLNAAGCWNLFGASGLLGPPSLEELAGDVQRVGFFPVRGRAWYQGDSAPMLYREVAGDFVLDALISMFDSGSAELVPPPGTWISAGLLAMPEGFLQGGDYYEYYAVKAGTHDPADVYGVKGEFTYDQAVTLPTQREIIPLDDDQSENLHFSLRLRICRAQGRLWMGYFDAQEGFWIPALREEAGAYGYTTDDPDDTLPDLGSTVLVGLAAEVYDPNTVSEHPASIRFQEIELHTLTGAIPSDCTRLDLY